MKVIIEIDVDRGDRHKFSVEFIKWFDSSDLILGLDKFEIDNTFIKIQDLRRARRESENKE